jgi:multicomponent Na+:H+ antiporter subunit C
MGMNLGHLESHWAHAVALYLLALGFLGAVKGRGLIHLAASLAVIEASSYVLLLSLGYRNGGQVPVFVDHPPGAPVVDPVVQALVLTDIVVGTALTALILTFGRLMHEEGDADPSAVRPFSG